VSARGYTTYFCQIGETGRDKQPCVNAKKKCWNISTDSSFEMSRRKLCMAPRPPPPSGGFSPFTKDGTTTIKMTLSHDRPLPSSD
jgi:hypothetical protein